MSKIFLMKIRNIVQLMIQQLQPNPTRKFLARHFLHSPQLSVLAMGCSHCLGGHWPVLKYWSPMITPKGGTGHLFIL